MDTFQIEGPMSNSRACACPMNLKLKQLEVPEEARMRTGVNRRDLGSARHKAIELMVKFYIWKRKWPPLDKVLKQIHKMWPDVAMVSAETEEKMMLFQENFQFTPENCIGSELKLEIDDNGLSRAYTPRDSRDGPTDGANGIVDYAEASGDTAVVTDFKNQMNIWPKSDLSRNEQVCGIYPYLIHKHFPRYTKFVCGIYYIEYGFHQLVELELDQVIENYNRLKSRWDRLTSLKADEIFPEPGPGRCNFCDWLEACPLGKDFMDTSGPWKISTPEEALKMARALEVNEQRVKAQKDAVRAWVEQNGNVELEPGIIRGFQKTTKKLWKKKELEELCEAEGKKFSEIVNIDSDKAKRFVNGTKTKMEDVCNFEAGTMFKSFKVTPSKQQSDEHRQGILDELCENKGSPAWTCNLEKGHKGDHKMWTHDAAGARKLFSTWHNKEDPNP